MSVEHSLSVCLSAPVLDDSTVSQLCEMGFPLEACRKAVYYTGNTGIDAAMNWVMGHMEDPGKYTHVCQLRKAIKVVCRFPVKFPVIFSRFLSTFSVAWI